MSLLGERLLEIHDALSAAGLPHAFGGAIALAYCTQEPRGTRDLDVNIFVSPAEAEVALAALPAGVAVGPGDVERAQKDGQVRLWWQDTPIDIFLNVHDFHAEVAAGIRDRPFMERAIPVVDCTALAVFKALFDRTRDWADLEEMIVAGSLDVPRAALWLRHFQGQESSVARRLEALRTAAVLRQDPLE